MKAIETTGNFNENGELTIDMLPVLRNQKVRLLILLEEDERKDWHHISAAGLPTAYGDNEPEYTLDMLKEPNVGYQP